MANVGKLVRFYDWKFNYLKSNGMLTCLLLSQDINALCELIDKNSDEDLQDSYDNFTINECLAYIRQSFLPVLLKQNAKIYVFHFVFDWCFKKPYSTSLTLFPSDVSYFIIYLFLGKTSRLNLIREKDSEEFGYQEMLMQEYIQICLILLDNT